MEQAAIAILGAAAAWLSQDARPRWAQWACIVGLSGQPLDSARPGAHCRSKVMSHMVLVVLGATEEELQAGLAAAKLFLEILPPHGCQLHPFMDDVDDRITGQRTRGL